MRTYRSLIIFATLLLLLMACSAEETNSNQAHTASDESSVEDLNEEEPVEENVTKIEYKNTFPLTGEPTNETVNHRVISVMVNNHTRARPQTGLSQADMIYEVLAEGQITRFLALYHSSIPDTKIGPVRSARPYYLDLSEGYQALYIHHGASPEAYQQIRNRHVSIDGIIYDNNGWLFERSSNRSAPHNSYFLTEGLDKIVEQKGISKEKIIKPLPFSEDGIQGNPVDQLTITYAGKAREVVSFTYDEENEEFLRSSDGEPTVDKGTNERIAVKNIWVIKTDHQVTDQVGRRDINLASGGKGYLLQEGKLLEVEWKNVDGRLLPYKGGKPLSFIPGKTWVNIIPHQAQIETTSSGN